MLLVALLLARSDRPSIEARLAGRSFPSVVQPWLPAAWLCRHNGVEVRLHESSAATAARHDLIIVDPNAAGIEWPGDRPGLAESPSASSLAVAQSWRRGIARLNPNAVVLADMDYVDAGPDDYARDSRIWLRGAKPSGDGRRPVDFSDREFLRTFLPRCKALVQSDIFDGVYLRDFDQESPARIALLRAVRSAIGDNAIIVIHTGRNLPVRSAPYANGVYVGNVSMGNWREAMGQVQWAEKSMRKPVVTAMEGFCDKSSTELYGMRMITTLALVSGDGMVVFSEPGGGVGSRHSHDWYEFWSHSLGRPRGPSTLVKDGTFRRDFDNGTVIFNPPGNAAVSVSFESLRTSVAKQLTGRTISVAPADGDILLNHPSL